MYRVEKLIKQISLSKAKLFDEMEKDKYINFEMFNSALRVINEQDKYIKFLQEKLEYKND